MRVTLSVSLSLIVSENVILIVSVSVSGRVNDNAS